MRREIVVVIQGMWFDGASATVIPEGALKSKHTKSRKLFLDVGGDASHGILFP